MEGCVPCRVPLPKDSIYAALPSTLRITTLFAPTLKPRNPLCGPSMFEVGLVVEKYPRMVDTPPFEMVRSHSVPLASGLHLVNHF